MLQRRMGTRGAYFLWRPSITFSALLCNVCGRNRDREGRMSSAQRRMKSCKAIAHLKGVAGTLEEEANYDCSDDSYEGKDDDEGGGPLGQGLGCGNFSSDELLKRR